ncbi:MAG: hypothetical protein Q8Q25_01700 [bacterium]|nr:hypothetical protein [bacterium]
MKRTYVMISLLLVTVGLGAQEADHIWLQRVRNHVFKNYTFQNMKYIEAFMDNSAIQAVWPNFLKEFLSNELLQRFKNALQSNDPQQSVAAHEMLVTIQSDLRIRREQLNRRYYALNKQANGYTEKCLVSGAMAVGLLCTGISLDNAGLSVTGFTFGLLGELSYGLTFVYLQQRLLLYPVCCQELEKISDYLDEVAYGQGVGQEATKE